MIYESMKHEELIAKPFLFFTTLLSHENFLAVGGAARGLGKLKDEKSLPYLLELIKKQKNSFILESSVLAIGDLNSKGSPDILFDVLMANEEDIFVKESAIRSLVKIEKEGSVPRVIKFLNKYIRSQKTYIYVYTAIGAIGLYQNKDAIDMLIRILYDNKIYNGYRIAAAIELEHSKSKRANLALKKFLLIGQEPDLEAKIKSVILSRKECK